MVNMFVLGIETSCDETAASLLEIKGKKFNPQIKVLSNVISSQVKIHARYGGVVPEVAARQHAEVIIPIIQKALQPTTYNLQTTSYKLKPDVIAVTAGPGLITSLRVGVDTAKTLAYLLKKPLVPVNHIEGHIYSNWLKPIGEISDFRFQISKINFPALILVVSGGHTELVLMKNHGQYKIIGETLDDAAGEAFDKVARLLGLKYPGGPRVAALAQRAQNDAENTQKNAEKIQRNSACKSAQIRF
jgi:N6-L-threonylcarbamoyladenine synthase